MGLNLKSFLSSTASILNDHNATGSTYFIASGCSKVVGKFYRGVQGMHESIPVPLEIYPVVFVELNNTSNVLERLGNSNKRDVELGFDIVTVTNYGAGSNVEGYAVENAYMENIVLTQNIETLLRNYLTLSGTVSWVETFGTEYGTKSGENYCNVVSKIKCKAQLKVRS
jgi:hypothetical protein